MYKNLYIQGVKEGVPETYMNTMSGADNEVDEVFIHILL